MAIETVLSHRHQLLLRLVSQLRACVYEVAAEAGAQLPAGKDFCMVAVASVFLLLVLRTRHAGVNAPPLAVPAVN